MSQMMVREDDRSHFFTPAPIPNKVTPAPAPELIGNLHSDSCLHSKSLKAESESLKANLLLLFCHTR